MSEIEQQILLELTSKQIRQLQAKLHKAEHDRDRYARRIMYLQKKCTACSHYEKCLSQFQQQRRKLKQRIN